MIFEHGMISKERDAKTEKELTKYFKEQLPHKDDYDGWEKRWKEHNWKAKDIKAYCKEFWRGYISFIKES